MWDILKVHGKNIGALNNFETDFENGCTVVQGINMDDDGQESNGSGKSTFFDAIAIALTGESLNGKSPKDIVNWEGQVKDMTVGIQLENKTINKTLYIERKIAKKRESETMYIKINGKPIESLPSKKGFKGSVAVKDGNQYIQDLLGISHENLRQRFLISGEKYTSFFGLTGRAKIMFVQQFANVKIVEEIIEEMKTEKQKFQKGIGENLLKREKMYGAVEQIVANIKSIKNGEDAERFRVKKESKIKAIKEQIEQIKLKHEKEILAFEKEADGYGDQNQNIKDNIKKNQKEITRLEAEKNLAKKECPGKEKTFREANEKYQRTCNDPCPHLQELQNKVTEINKSVSSETDLKSKISQITIEGKELKTLLKHKTECPECKHEFSIQDPKISIPEVKRKIEETMEGWQDFTNQKGAQEKNTLKLKHEKELIDQKISTFDKGKKQRQEDAWKEKEKAEESMGQAKRKINQAQETAQRLEKDILSLEKEKKRNLNIIMGIKESIKKTKESTKENDALKEIEALKAEEYLSANLEAYTKKAKGLAQGIKEIDLIKTGIEKDIGIRDQSVLNFDDFKFFVIHERINSIAQRINHYLEIMKSGLTVQIEGFKKNRNGEVKQEFTPMILRDGDNPQLYSQFSAGEKKRLDLASDLAFQEIINAKAGNGGLNFYLNDELLNPVDTQGILNLVKGAQKLQTKIVLATHSAPGQMFPKTITITKENGVAKVKAA